MPSQDLTVRIGADISRLQSGINRAAASVRQFSEQTERLGRSLTRNITLPLLAIGGASSKLALDFDTSMRKITGLVGIASEEVDKMRGSVLELAGETARAPGELADALFFVTSAGFRGAEAMDVLEVSAKAAAAGLGETKIIADAVTSAVNAYGIENLSAAAATDTLVAAVREGKLEAESLTPVLGQLLPTASAMGISFQQVSGMLALFSRTGTDAAMGAVSLQNIMLSLARPTKEVRDLIEGAGLSFDKLRRTATRSPDGLIQVMKQLEGAFGGNDQALSQLFPNVRAFRGVMSAMSQDADIAKGILEGVADSAGIGGEAFEAAQGPAFRLSQAFTKLKIEAVKLGQDLFPVIEMISEFVGRVTSAISKIDEETRAKVIKIAFLLGASGPLLIAIAKVGKAIAGLMTMFTALTGPVGIAIAAIAGGALLIIKNWDSISEYFTTGEGAKMWSRLKETVSESMTLIKEIVSETLDLIKELWDAFGDDIVRIVEASLGRVVKIIEFSLGRVNVLMKKFRGEFDTELNLWEDSVLTTAGKIDGILVGTLSKTFTRVKDAFVNVFGKKNLEAPSIADVDLSSLEEVKQFFMDLREFESELENMALDLGIEEKDLLELTQVREQLLEVANIYDRLQSKTQTTSSPIISEEETENLKAFGKTVDRAGVSINDLSVRLTDQIGVVHSYSRAFGISTQDVATSLQDQVGLFKEHFANITQTVQTNAQRWPESMRQNLARIQEITFAITEAIKFGITDMVFTFVEGLGQMMAGTATLDQVFVGVLKSLADMAVKIGKIILAAGLGIDALKISLADFTGVGAIVAGAALIAIGSAAKAALGNLGSGGGGGARVGGFNPSIRSEQQNVNVTGEFVAKGKNLVAVIKNNSKVDNRVGRIVSLGD